MAKKFLFLLLFLAISCSTLKYEKHPREEFRGVWVATVVNIDWPKSGNDATEKQKKDFLDILDFYDSLNFNALIVQIRTAGDAFYPSELAPWSRFLTREEGQPKAGFENPLEWMIDRTHERGMQFHAWLNPYRATFDLDTTLLDSTKHDFYKHRDWMVKYGKKYYYNPGEPKVWEHLTNVVEEVVVNYDIDGVHFDDYFYPYKISREKFADSATYAQYGLTNQNLEDWRRSNVDSLVKNVHQTIKANKPWIQFGISPFGVWKNKSTDAMGSDTKAGQTTYEDLFADPLSWIENKWIDYIVPQAYWSMEYPAASHRKIAEWWSNNSSNTNLYMGNGPYKIRNNADVAWNNKKELPEQLILARNLAKIKGNVFFSAKSLPQHADVSKKLQRKFYKLPAEVPFGHQNTLRNIPKPVVISHDMTLNKPNICISHYDSIPRFLSIYRSNGTKNRFQKLLKKVYLPANESKTCFSLDKTSKKVEFIVKDAFGNESQPTPLIN